jgi:beta-fructofuranosidase
VSDPDKAADPHFPVVHIRPPRGWVNDPNGPIWHRGQYHLFFQYARVVPPLMRQVVWAHSSSPDLAHWDIHDVALAPGPRHPGVEGFWSGNSVEHEGRLFAFYSAYSHSEQYQPPHMAMSDNGGHSFAEDRRVVPPPEERLWSLQRSVQMATGTPDGAQ